MRNSLARARADSSGLRLDRRALFGNLVGALLFAIVGHFWRLPRGVINSIILSLLYAVVGFGALWVLEFLSLWALAPYRIERDRANALTAENTELRLRIASLTPKPRALPSLQRREDDLRQWIEKAIKGGAQSYMWLGQVVPYPNDFKDYLEPLENWASRNQSEITIEYDDVRADGTRDIHFKARRYWWP